MTFERGDHLRNRRGIYDHHGIYVSDDCVIEFGGSDLFRKGQISVRRVTLDQFAHTPNVEVVKHPSPGRMFGPNWLPGPLPPDEITTEAERLADLGTIFVGRYTLFGSNCEHLANWCVTGNYFESLQVKKFFQAQVAISMLLALTLRTSHRSPWWRTLAAIQILTTAISQYQWQRAPYKFWKGVERPPRGPDGTGSDWS